MQYNQRATKFSHVYTGQSIGPFLYIIEAHATGKKLRLFGKNWPNLLFQIDFVDHPPLFALSSFWLLPVLTRYRKTIKHPVAARNYDRDENIWLLEANYLLVYYRIEDSYPFIFFLNICPSFCLLIQICLVPKA